MFDSIRGRLQFVQEGIKASLSFKGVKGDEPRHGKKQVRPPVNFEAGGDLLNKYQNEWSDIHKICEENAGNAQKLDTAIGNLHKSIEKEWNSMTRLTNNLSCLPQVIQKTEEIIEDIGKFHSLLLEVEDSLIRLTDINETQQLQEKFVEGRFQLALYREKKLNQLENVRAQLTDEHRTKIFQKEKIMEGQQKEKREIFDEAFKEDIEKYKETGSVPKIEIQLKEGPSLEEVVLDMDASALDELLND
uniref:Dysbindin n=2 Tax=Clastoptera arizonana TaxID=38151 RepID=A0A1B6E5N0_9HEMI